MDMWQAFKADINDFVGLAEDEAEGDGAADGSFESFKSDDDEGGQQLDTSGDDGDGVLNRSNGDDASGDNDENNVNVTDCSHEENECSGYDANSMFYSMGGDLVSDILFGNNDDGGNEDEDENHVAVATTPEVEAARRCELEVTFTEPLLLLEESVEHNDDDFGGKEQSPTGRNVAIGNSDNENSDNNENSSSNGNEYEEEVNMSIDEDAMERQDILQFLDTFDIQAHTQEIAKLLDNDIDSGSGTTEPTTTTTTMTPLQHHFQTLVPQTVSYKQFWTNYYYRCNPDRIAKQWERQINIQNLKRLKQQEQRERAIKEVSDAALNIGRSAASFLWSGALSEAISGVGEVVEEAATGVITNVGGVVEEAAMSFKAHQSKGRPLFVMEAVEDDDDTYYEGEESGLEDEEEDDEEERGVNSSREEGGLGWSSGGDNDEDEEVNFLDDVSLADDEAGQVPTSKQHAPLKLESLDVVRLRQSLMHAEEQRNTMMQMVEERNEEMCNLRSVLEQNNQCLQSASASDRSNTDGVLHDLKREVQWLKHVVAATSSDNSDGRESSTNALKSILAEMRSDLHQSSASSESSKAFEAAIQDLQSKILATKNNNVTNVEPSKQTRLQEETNQCNNLQSETKKTNRSIDSCQKQLLELQEQRKNQTAEQAVQLEQVMSRARTSSSSSLEAATPTSSGTSSSMSSGIKVPADGWDGE